MSTMVFRYGVPRRLPTGAVRPDGSPVWERVQLPEQLLHQVRLRHQMRNQLVELQQAAEKQRRELWSTWPEVAEVETAQAVAEQRVADLSGQARQEHSADRSVATRPATANQLREARREVKHLKGRRRAAVAAAYEVLKPQLEKLRGEYQAAVKACRQQYAAAGLYWATYNAVLADHRVRVQLVARARTAGRPAQLRFRRWDGTGGIAVQLQRLVGEPPRAPQLFAAEEGKWRNVLRLSPWMPPEQWDRLPRAQRRRRSAGQVTLAIGGGQKVTLPVVIHRMMPAEADVVEAELVLSRLAGHWTAHLCVTVRVPDPAPVEGRNPVSLHCGWRQRPDGSVRVGVWSGTTSPPPRRLLAGAADRSAGHTGVQRYPAVLVPHDGWGEVILPAWAVDVAGRPATVRSRRDLAQAPTQEKIAAWLDSYPQPDPSDDDPQRILTGARVRQWRSASRLAALALRWRETPPVGDGTAEVTVLLEMWRRQDRHLWEWEAHERHQLLAWRDDAWRQVAAWLADQAGTLVVDDTDFAALRRRVDVADDDPVLPGAKQQQARARAALAAPGRLRQLAKAAADRRGVAVRQVSALNLSRTCPHCGHVGGAHPRYAAAAVVTCPECDRSYDQDRSAVGMMLARID